MTLRSSSMGRVRYWISVSAHGRLKVGLVTYLEDESMERPLVVLRNPGMSPPYPGRLGIGSATDQ